MSEKNCVTLVIIAVFRAIVLIGHCLASFVMNMENYSSTVEVV